MPDIYAAGDCAELEGSWYGLWRIAKDEGEIAAINAAGGDLLYQVPTPPYVLNTMDMHLLSAENLKNTEGCKIQIETEKSEYRYQKILRRERKLQGFILLGDISKEPALLKELQAAK